MPRALYCSGAEMPESKKFYHLPMLSTTFFVVLLIRALKVSCELWFKHALLHAVLCYKERLIRNKYSNFEKYKERVSTQFLKIKEQNWKKV